MEKDDGKEREKMRRIGERSEAESILYMVSTFGEAR